jgi:GPH family glycoside/pentoside/hexuronide:cation symporter
VRDVEQTALALLGITLAFSVVPGVLGLLKGVALLIYPLDQRRVDEIEKALAERRTHAEPEAQPA